MHRPGRPLSTLRLAGPRDLSVPRSPRTSGRLLAGLLLLLLAIGGAGCSFGERSDVLVIVRADDPVSGAIGAAFASRYDVPDQLILPLAVESDARIVDAETYLETIAKPIESHLAAADPDNRVRLLVTTRGLPLMIGRCALDRPDYPRACEASAVDAALAQLGRTGADDRAFRRVPNPLFQQTSDFESAWPRNADSPLRFLVARLTAPPGADKTTTEALPPGLAALLADDPAPVDGAPLWQIATGDAPGERSTAAALLLDPLEARLPHRGHRVCNDCVQERPKAGANGVVLLSPTLPDAEGPLTSPGVVIALGGPSGSLRSNGDGFADFDAFVGEWLAHGARAISTHVAEPSLPFASRPTSQLEAWAAGRTAIEAHFASLPQLGWMNVFVGDPFASLPAPEQPLPEDRDRDGHPDAIDNCPGDANPDQRDSDDNGIGNRCDPDVDGDGRVTTSWGAIYPVDRRGDLEAIALTARNGPYDPLHDLDGDGQVDTRDLAIAQLWLFRPPGPGRPTRRGFALRDWLPGGD